MPPPPPSAEQSSSHSYRRAPDPTASAYGAGGTGYYKSTSNTGNTTGGSSGGSSSSSSGGGNPYEKHAYSSGFPTPTGLRVTALDSTTAEVQWDPPPTASASSTGKFSGVSYNVELSWAASTAPYGKWEVAGTTHSITIISYYHNYIQSLVSSFSL
jgi:hypothetical protein